MQAHLQARGLDVWRVTELGKKNETKTERQYDAIAKSILIKLTRKVKARKIE